MCGICGIADLQRMNRIEDYYIRRMADKLTHRGPDGSAVYHDGNLSFGFTRLSIIDLHGGMQPIFNEDRSLMMVCNGEIFNYVELRRMLIAKGHQFRTHTDVECIIHLYEEEREQMFNLLNGQFAFVIYDFRTQELICAKDHFGIAPFFYTLVDDFFIFGSEIKAILEHPAVKRAVNLVGLDQILTLPGLANVHTMFDNIHSLENGHYLRIKDGRVELFPYWDLVYPEADRDPAEDRGEAYYIDKLEELLTDSIRMRLRADVPVGLYVSGGLDSSLVAGKARQLLPNAELKSFSIDFEDQSLSESRYQRLAANHFRLQHQEIMFRNTDMSEKLPSVIYYSESPLKETYNCASLVLSEHVRRSGIKVVLSGEGADELFAGYIGYRFDKLRQLGDMPASPEETAERHLRRRMWGDEHFFYEKNYGAFEAVKRELYSDRVSERFHEVNCLHHPLLNVDRLHNRDIIHKRSYIDFKLRVVNHLVADHGDRMGFASSIEARYPFLDKELAAFVTQIPTHYLLNGFEEKYILKRVAERVIPQPIIEREKFSFVAQGSPELLKSNIEYITDLLSYDTIKRQGYFNADTVERLKKEYMADGFSLNVPFDSDLLIVVLTFGIFMERFGMPDLT